MRRLLHFMPVLCYSMYDIKATLVSTPTPTSFSIYFERRELPVEMQL